MGDLMGYWNATAEGDSLAAEDTGLIWGDTPADIFDLAIVKIVAAFREDVGRDPTKAEIKAGIEFSLGAYDGDVVSPDGECVEAFSKVRL